MRSLVLALVALGGALRLAQAEDALLSQADTASAAKIYTSKCSRCHKFYDPTEYSDSDWNRWMGKMKKKAKLSSEQYDLLVKYLDKIRHDHATGSPQPAGRK